MASSSSALNAAAVRSRPPVTVSMTMSRVPTRGACLSAAKLPQTNGS